MNWVSAHLLTKAEREMHVNTARRSALNTSSPDKRTRVSRNPCRRSRPQSIFHDEGAQMFTQGPCAARRAHACPAGRWTGRLVRKARLLLWLMSTGPRGRAVQIARLLTCPAWMS